jgi:hypothetical protein
MRDFSDKRTNDEDIADFTDALLEEGDLGREVHDLPFLERTVLMLARTLRPEAPPTDLKQRVQKHVHAEWDRLHASERRPRRGWHLPAFRRLAGGLALALTLIVVGLVLLAPVEGVELTATTSGDWGRAILALGVLGVLALGLLWFLRSRR